MDNIFHEVISRRAGFAGEILIFEMAQHALDYLLADQASAPTLIFLDINMPGMDGFEFAGKVEALLQRIPAATIVMLSSSCAERDMKRAAKVGAICCAGHGRNNSLLTRRLRKYVRFALHKAPNLVALAGAQIRRRVKVGALGAGFYFLAQGSEQVSRVIDCGSLRANTPAAPVAHSCLRRLSTA